MENLEEALNLIFDRATVDPSLKIKDLQIMEVSEIAVKQSIMILNLLGDLPEGCTFEKGILTLKSAKYKYSLPYDMLPEIVARFKQNKTKYRTKAAVLYNARTRC